MGNELFPQGKWTTSPREQTHSVLQIVMYQKNVKETETQKKLWEILSVYLLRI